MRPLAESASRLTPSASLKEIYHPPPPPLLLLPLALLSVPSRSFPGASTSENKRYKGLYVGPVHPAGTEEGPVPDRPLQDIELYGDRKSVV